ncbi:MAG UNVERIFIED_CONTAM: hypothetical protein LVR18_32910 [Planctomycetaceae bacterium]|jgi:hypothetical protein
MKPLRALTLLLLTVFAATLPSAAAQNTPTPPPAQAANSGAPAPDAPTASAPVIPFRIAPTA